MFGHYLRVQEAALLLGVSPGTVRWYSHQYGLPAYRIGQGQVQHRRFRYLDVQRLALQFGQVLPPEPPWDGREPILPADAAKYLGLSLKFLIDGHYLTAGQKLTREELLAAEAAIYRAESLDPSPTHTQEHQEIRQNEEEIPMMNRNEHCCNSRHEDMSGMKGPGMHGHRGMHSRGMMGNPMFNPEDLLSLRSMKRHLEAQQADIADRIQEIDKLIANHPDSTPQ